MLRFSKEISFLLVKPGADCVEISLESSYVRTYFQKRSICKDVFPRVPTWDTSNENKNVMRFDAQRQNTIRNPSKEGINLFTQETGIARNSNRKENRERKMSVCLPLSPWQTVSNEQSQGGNEGNCRCKWQTQYQIKYWRCQKCWAWSWRVVKYTEGPLNGTATNTAVTVADFWV